MANQAGTYGTQGTAAPGNTPGGRYGGATWIDASGNLWLFGGTVAPSDTNNNLNDVWKYSGGQWTWIAGSNSYNQKGIYGSQGIASRGNTPGARSDAATWKDQSGNFWLFGGVGLDANGSSEALNDLWKYSAGQWTWMAGRSVATEGQPGVYGTRGTAAPGNIPGGRQDAVSWIDQSGNFWLFGGYGFDSTGMVGDLGDLWKYSGGEWTWMGGADVVFQPGSYGIRGTAASSNVPGARSEAAGWTDAGGNFWLFGGTLGPEGHYELLNDLWKYSNGEWTWIAGSNVVNQPGTYGIQGTAAPENTPGARAIAAGWADSAGNFWIFGGGGYDSTGRPDPLNDLWKYSAGQWTWIAGSNIRGPAGTYGTQGVTTAGNTPGGRGSQMSWIDASGTLWLFGGDGYDSAGTFGYLNDLWKFEP
jgi:hypothetical protein